MTKNNNHIYVTNLIIKIKKIKLLFFNIKALLFTLSDITTCFPDIKQKKHVLFTYLVINQCVFIDLTRYINILNFSYLYCSSSIFVLFYFVNYFNINIKVCNKRTCNIHLDKQVYFQASLNKLLLLLFETTQAYIYFIVLK